MHSHVSDPRKTMEANNDNFMTTNIIDISPMSDTL